MRTIILAAAAIGAAASAGPMSKYDEKQPSADYTSKASIFDIERCLLDLNGWPIANAYSQPDRPGEVTLIWTAPTGHAAGKAVLRQVPNGTKITYWVLTKQAEACAPR